MVSWRPAQLNGGGSALDVVGCGCKESCGQLWPSTERTRAIGLRMTGFAHAVHLLSSYQTWQTFGSVFHTRNNAWEKGKALSLLERSH